MNVSRDRMSRPIDISSLLENSERRVNLVVDEPGLHWKGLSTTGQSGGDGGGECGGSAARRKAGLRRMRRCRGVNRSLVGKENQRPKNLRKGQGRGSVLPSWYPRTPLRDITAIVRVIFSLLIMLYAFCFSWYIFYCYLLDFFMWVFWSWICLSNVKYALFFSL